MKTQKYNVIGYQLLVREDDTIELKSILDALEETKTTWKYYCEQNNINSQQKWIDSEFFLIIFCTYNIMKKREN